MKAPPRSHALLEAIARTDDAMFAVDAGQRIIQWSERAERLFGVTAADALGCPCYEVVRGERAAGPLPAFRYCERDCSTICAARAGQGVPAYDIAYTTPAGRRVWINVSILPLRPEVFGEAVAVHLCRDVSERRRAEMLAQRVESAYRLYAAEVDASRRPAERPGAAAPAPPHGPPVTPREREILQALARGEDTRRTAQSLGISAGTLRNHVSALMRKLGGRTRLEAVLRAGQLGLLPR